MPDPDFDQIARQLVDVAHVDEWPAFTQETQRETAMTAIAEQLRLVWNARGAADSDAVNGSLLTGNVPKVVDAIRSLDR